MAEIVKQILLYGLNAATLTLLFALLFVHVPRGWWMRGITLALGAAAVGSTAYFIPANLGYPDPNPGAGEYDLIGFNLDERANAMYVFVAAPGDPVPRHYKLPFDLRAALALQKIREELTVYQDIWVGIETPPGKEARYRFFTKPLVR